MDLVVVTDEGFMAMVWILVMDLFYILAVMVLSEMYKSEKTA